MKLIREINDGVIIKEPIKAYNKYLKEFGDEDREYFIVLGLDTRNKVIYREIVAIGILNSCVIHPREVFKKAILMSANSIIIAHNHPSQDLESSPEDLKVTKELTIAGEFLGIKLIDSLIFNKETYYSIKEDF